MGTETFFCFLDEGSDTSYVNEDVVEKQGVGLWEGKSNY